MDDIVLVPYDPLWPGMYETEVKRLQAADLPGGFVRWEHFGSTAVPNLTAKPIIDILAGVESLKEARQNAVPVLERLGYAFWYDNPNLEHLFFVRGLPPNGPRTQHLHVVSMDSPFWERLLFRDYLRAHPNEATRYAELKQELAARYSNDREAYTESKGVYVQEVTARAKASLLARS